MGTNMESPNNLQFNADGIIFISLILVEIFKFLLKHLKFHYFRKNNFFSHLDLEFLHQNWRVHTLTCALQYTVNEIILTFELQKKNVF
jgi:hypothetical protein